MPDTDALNRALNRYVLATRLSPDWPGNISTATHTWLLDHPDPFCSSLDAAVAALNALDMDWLFDPFDIEGDYFGPLVSVIPRQDGLSHCALHPKDTTPAALATALVQAALAVLQREEETP